MVLIDLGLPAGPRPPTRSPMLFAAAAERGLVTDGVIAQSQAQRAAFWSIREAIPDANRASARSPRMTSRCRWRRIPDFIAEAGRAIASIGDFRVNCFGHLGDGNLHYNVFPPPGAHARRARGRPRPHQAQGP